MSGAYKVLMVLIGVALVLLLLFNGALLWQVGKLVDAGESEAKAKPERIEVHHEPTVINKPTKHTHTRSETTIREGEGTLPNTGGQHKSPVQIGADVGRLEHSRQVRDSVLVACKRDAFGPAVESRGRRAVGTHIYSVRDGSDDGRCKRNFTGRKLNQHWLKEGVLTSQVSNH